MIITRIDLDSSFNQLHNIENLANNIALINKYGKNGNATFDISSKRFTRPLCVLPISYLIKKRKYPYTFENGYLKKMEFPIGVDYSLMSRYKSYIPISFLEMTKNQVQDDNLIDELSAIYLQYLNDSIFSLNDFLEINGMDIQALLVAEMLDNISQHAKANSITVFAQYWHNINQVEICIIDDGVGIYKSLKDAGRVVLSEMDALEKVINNQLSAKDEYGIQHRGTGILNTSRLLANSDLEGSYCIYTSNVAYYTNNYKRPGSFLTFDETFSAWEGTIVSMCFKIPVNKINKYKYVT